MRITLTTFLISIISMTNSAYAGFYAELSASFLDFDYTEFDDTGIVLDTETGVIRGNTLSIGYHSDTVEHSLRHTMYEDQVDYDGITSTVNPLVLNTRTDMSLRRTAYRQLWTGLRQQYKTSVYAELGYNRWHRHILPTTTPFATAGLMETFTWWTAEVGLNFDIKTTHKHAFEAGIGVLANIDSSISILLRGNTSLGTNDEVVNFKLGDEPGYHATILYKYRFRPDIIFETVADYTRWEFGTNTVTVPRLPTAVTSTVTEPASKSKYTTIRAGVVVYF